MSLKEKKVEVENSVLVSKKELTREPKTKNESKSENSSDNGLKISLRRTTQRFRKKINKLQQKKMPKSKENRISKRSKTKELVFEAGLNGLRQALKAIFCLKTHIEDDIILDNDERRILNTLYEKRFKIKTAVNSIRNVEYYFNLSKQVSTKRSEEIYKFLFKNSFKFLKRQFYTQTSLDKELSKEDKKSLFYEYYFKEASKIERKRIGYFYLPLTPSNIQKQNKVKLSKTINTKYISLIFTSDLFVRDFSDFIENHIHKFCVVLIEKKIDNLVNKWEGMLKTHGNSLRTIDMICDDIKWNKKYKFPWSMHEVETVRKEGQKLIFKHS